MSEPSLQAIEEAVARAPEGIALSEIERALRLAPPRRTLQYRLRRLVEVGRLAKTGHGRGARYRMPEARELLAPPPAPAEGRSPAGQEGLPLFEPGRKIQHLVRRDHVERRPAGYDRSFLDGYCPNETFYLSEAARARLAGLGRQQIAAQPAGSYARQILNRLLIELAWNSSRLEGNTYSLIDTKRLVAFGEEAEGKERLEAQMILNHKDAIAFLVEGAGEIAFDRQTIFNLHALLADNLLASPGAEGRLRRIAVGIEGSVFRPLEVPQLIEKCFDQLLVTAAAIEDPFEQAFFVMVQLPYLQPFDDVNKRVSRLAASIPFIKANLAPLSFEGVPRETYTEAILGIYELRRPEMLRDLFLWAYERSAERYAAVRQSQGEPDPFRLKHREALREVVGRVVRGGLGRAPARAFLKEWREDSIDEGERERFIEIAEDEILALHEGNYARYRLRPAEFATWQRTWGQ